MDATEAMTSDVNTTSAQDRVHLTFESAARERFAFLNDLGFSEVESLPTLVRYRKDGVEVDVYHGRQSYEIGAGISGFGTRYAMAEVIRTADPATAKRYRNAVATTPEGVVAGLEELGSLMKRYGIAALRGDPQFFSALEEQRKSWSEEYALDVLADQLRPQADEAFRRGDYSTAAELYARIRSRLSPAETKKLTLAEERSRS
ncbi:MAG: hypothetical protein ABIF28_19095 [Pseudomonadota bacterium]